MNSDNDKLENSVNPSKPAPACKKDRVSRPLLPMWLTITLASVVTITIFLIVMLVRFAKNTIQEREITAESILFAPASVSASKLPKYDETKFIKVIEAPGVNAIVNWHDAIGNDCLAASSYDFMSFQSGNIYRVYDDIFTEIAKIECKGNISATLSNVLVVEDVTGDSVPEIIACKDGNSGTVACYDLAGNVLTTITGGYMGMEPFFLIDSPTSLTKRVLCVSSGSQGTGGYQIHELPSGNRLSADEQVLNQNLGSRVSTFEQPVVADWDGDGNEDIFFPGYSSSSYGDALTPYVNRQFLNQIEVPGTEGLAFASPRVFRYKDENGSFVELVAVNNINSDTNFNILNLSPFSGNTLIWKSSDGKISGKKEFKKGEATLSRSSLVLSDLTGDGIPEICAAVCSKKIVVLDLEGNELLMENYFKNLQGYSQGITCLIGGDFDNDGYQDLAFSCENGIFIPDLSSLRESK